MFSVPVTIGKNVWTGTRAIILPDIAIGDCSIIGANVFVTKHMTSNAILVGIPAKCQKK